MTATEDAAPVVTVSFYCLLIRSSLVDILPANEMALNMGNSHL